MKAETHPEYHEIKVVMTDGTEYTTRSTWGKEGDVLKLDVDPLTHPAWQGGAGKVIEKGQLDKFEGRYGTFLSGDASDDKKPVPKQTEKPQEEAKEKEKPAEAAPQEETPAEEPTAAEEAPAEEEKPEEAPAEDAPAESSETPAEEDNKE